ncbi:hypothetical protein COY25_00560 [Candidatus Uhrbacteria bacterium CG_4_10_14_0_2_um_filter_41_7]|nr:MAG: hypothetical protein COY25_00560 [Candidatus Uhrbacteria bacterium CG_4_10_14_0_2_um_filter_41_7]
MPLTIRVSAHDESAMDRYLGGLELWESAVGQLKKVLDDLGKEYIVQAGEAAFYGPKIDFVATDAIGREWQLATIQLDFNMPARFELEYIDENNEKQRPVMVHRAILGSVERFMGTLIEHYAGAFPFWLAPEQIRLAPVSDEFTGFANELRTRLLSVDLRAEVDNSKEGVGKKIRNAAMQKTPWTVVIGQKEVDGGDITVKVFGSDEDLIFSQEEFIEKAKESAKLPV